MWPAKIQKQIDDLSLDNDSRLIIDDMKRCLHVRNEMTANTQFHPISISCTVYAPLTPCEQDVIPRLLVPFYSSYPASAQFYLLNSNIIFYNRHQIAESARQLPRGMIDLAYHSAGMGFVYIHTYVKKSDKMLTTCSQIPHSHWPFQNMRTKREILLEEYKDYGKGNSELIIHTFGQWWNVYKSSYSDS